MESNGLMEKRKSVLFLAGVFLIGIITLLPYGAHLDQFSEQKILYSNIKEYLLHLPGDTPELVQDLEKYGIVEISIDEDRDHGMAAYYLAFPVWYINQSSGYAGNIFWHAYTFMLVFWGMCSLFFLSKELYQDGILSAFIVLLFFLTPRMFAESHYNDKDMVLLSLTFTIFLSGKRLLKEQSAKNLFVFAFAGALAANLKIVGIWIFGAVGLYILFYFIITKQIDKKLFGKALGCILLWGILLVLLTPACWTDMVSFFKYLFINAVDYDLWHDYVLFNGRMLHRDYTGMPRKYLPMMMLITIPIGVLLLYAYGCIMALADFIGKKGKCLEDTGYVLLMISVGGVPLLFAILSATPLYNGWRHFYFVYATVIGGAGYGAFKLIKIAKVHKREVLVQTGALIYLLFLAIGIFTNYPQEHCYFNLLAGSNVLERFELDYWDMSIRQAYDCVLEDAEGKTISVGSLNAPTGWGVEENQKILPQKERELISIAGEWKDADYVIVNTTYAYMYTNDEYSWVKEHYEFTNSITAYGNTICEVYHKQE